MVGGKSEIVRLCALRSVENGYPVHPCPHPRVDLMQTKPTALGRMVTTEDDPSQPNQIHDNTPRGSSSPANASPLDCLMGDGYNMTDRSYS